MSGIFTYPFIPPWKELRQTMETRHATCFFFDSQCRELPPKAKVQADTAMVKAYQEAQRMARLAERKSSEEPPDTAG